MRRCALVVALVVLAAGACGGSASKGAPKPAAAALPDNAVPAQLGGFTTAPEDITAQAARHAGKSTWFATTRLWSLRSGPRLEATLQVGVLSADAPTTEAFRQRMVGQIGQTAPRERILDGDLVYVTASNQQPVFIWFRGSRMFVLSVATDVKSPRTLLRAGLALR